MRGSGEKADAAARTVSGAGLVVSCVPMVAMLPGAVGGALGLVGLGTSGAAAARWAPALNVVAQPLLLFSIALLVVGGLRCGRLAVALAAVGGGLLYLSMYVWTTDSGATSPALFYVGLACFIDAYGVSWWRRRRKQCRPLVSALLAQRLLVATVVVGTIAVVGYATLVDSSDAVMPMTVRF